MVTLADIASAFSCVDHTCNVAELIDAALRTEELERIQTPKSLQHQKCQTG